MTLESGVACGNPSPPKDAKRPPGGGVAIAGPGDSLAKLHRRLLTDSNPRPIGQAIVCEHVRLGRLYGDWEASAIAKEVRETLFTPNDEAARLRVEKILGTSTFDLSCGYPPGPPPKPTADDSAR